MEWAWYISSLYALLSGYVSSLTPEPLNWFNNITLILSPLCKFSTLQNASISTPPSSRSLVISLSFPASSYSLGVNKGAMQATSWLINSSRQLEATGPTLYTELTWWALSYALPLEEASLTCLCVMLPETMPIKKITTAPQNFSTGLQGSVHFAKSTLKIFIKKEPIANCGADEVTDGAVMRLAGCYGYDNTSHMSTVSIIMQPYGTKTPK